jgi:hypothetical protein
MLGHGGPMSQNAALDSISFPLGEMVEELPRRPAKQLIQKIRRIRAPLAPQVFIRIRTQRLSCLRMVLQPIL